MKRAYLTAIFSVAVGLLVPLGILSLLDVEQKDITLTPALPAQAQATPGQTKEVLPEISIPVLMGDGEVADMDLDDYLVGVVLAEMPASFHTEALKAQAVVARTYTLKRVASGGKHKEGAVCTSPACCQAYTTPEDYIGRGNSENNLNKVRSAVYDTSGQVLLYNGAYIEATYFSCSGGMTEDAVAVWGSDVPYLQAVESPGEESATHFTDAVSFSISEFLSKLGLGQQTIIKIGKITYTDGGGVANIDICGKTFKGTTVRSKLGLRSTVFTITVAGNTVTVKTNGFGHRVGMSQYGAQAMAEDGSAYQQILGHYYQGTSLGSVKN